MSLIRNTRQRDVVIHHNLRLIRRTSLPTPTQLLHAVEIWIAGITERRFFIQRVVRLLLIANVQFQKLLTSLAWPTMASIMSP